MFVKMIQTLATPWGSHRAGHVYDVPDAIGTDWRRKHLAVHSVEPPPTIGQLLARLDDGAGKPCLFLPPAGMEFGHEVMSHMRLVHFHRASRKVVCCRPGHEVLYPSAAVHVTDWTDPTPDAERIATNNRTPQIKWPDLIAARPDHHPIAAGGLSPTQEIFPINPHVRLPFRPKLRGLRADVVLGVRRRAFAPQRNWPHWHTLAAALTSAGLTFAVVGAADTSIDLPGQVCHTGTLDTDAAIELLQNCQLYIGTDTGPSHLAAEVGASMMVFRETRTASRDLTARMATMNAGRVVVIEDGWDNPAAVAHAAAAVTMPARSNT